MPRPETLKNPVTADVVNPHTCHGQTLHGKHAVNLQSGQARCIALPAMLWRREDPCHRTAEVRQAPADRLALLLTDEAWTSLKAAADVVRVTRISGIRLKQRQ